MAKNILLTFLSTVGIKNKDDKKEIDKTDGRNNTIRAKYLYDLENGGPPAETHITNESAVRYLAAHLPEGNSLDKIFIFTTDDVLNQLKCEEAFIGIRDKEYLTHLEYFGKRLSMFLPDYNDSLLETQGYNGVSWNDYMDDIVEMAKKIQKFAKDDEVTLSVDLTGGFRNANMIVLSIAKLLQYSGISIDKILYSNISVKGDVKKVEESNGIYELFDLVSGAEEFVRFGSVDSIDDYFKKNKDSVSAELDDLLKAMKHFAQQIRLCHYGTLKKAIRDLNEKVYAFEKYIKERNNDVYAKLFARLLSRIHKEYDTILQADFTDVAKSDIELIKWCLNKDYLQQVLTLYTERIPEIIVAGGIVNITDSYVTVRGESRKGLPTTVAYDLFVENTDSDERKKIDSVKDKSRKKITQGIKEICSKKLAAERMSKEEIRQKVFGSLQEPDKDGKKPGDNIFVCNEAKLLDLLVQYDAMRHILGTGGALADCDASFWVEAYMAAESKAIADKNAKWSPWDSEPDEKAKYNKLMRAYFGNNIANNELQKLLNLNVLAISNIIRKIILGQVTHPQEIDLETIAEIDAEYRQIRNERVISNHAKADVSAMDYKTLKNALRKGVDHIERALEKIS